MNLKYQKTKTVRCRDDFKSSNAISGNFVYGCKNNDNQSFCAYCYVNRNTRDFVYVNTNTDELLEQCDLWVKDKPLIKIPDQVHPTLYMIDIGCSTDVNQYWNKYNWIYVFDWFKNHPRLGATFATKWVNTKLLDYEPNKKIRVRMSLMPESLRQKVEKGTSPILNRIKFLNDLVKSNYDTHINLSPIIYYDGWLQDYEKLFQDIEKHTQINFKQQMFAECIFLTHNEKLHLINSNRDLKDAEELLWRSDIQEAKVSQYGGNNVRYQWQFKNELIEQFTELYESYFGKTIRYIF